MILLVRELTRNLPPLAEIEFHGNRIRPNDSKAARLVTTGSDLSFTLREQFSSNTLSTVLTKYPQVANASSHPVISDSVGQRVWVLSYKGIVSARFLGALWPQLVGAGHCDERA